MNQRWLQPRALTAVFGNFRAIDLSTIHPQLLIRRLQCIAHLCSGGLCRLRKSVELTTITVSPLSHLTYSLATLFTYDRPESLGAASFYHERRLGYPFPSRSHECARPKPKP